MTTQEDSGVALSIGHEPQSFRLLELPPPLLELLTSSNPPILYLKSEPTASTAIGDTAPNAYVCTDDRTFEVRQIQSSNTLYVVQSSEGVASDEGNGSLGPGITVIGQCKALLELAPVKTAATKFLKQALPVFSDSNVVPGDLKTQRDLLSDAPFSAGEFEAAWIEICGFELDLLDLGLGAWRPSAPLLLNHWKYFIGAVTMLGLDPTTSFPISDVASMVEEENCFPVVLQAMLKRLSSEFVTGTVIMDGEKCVLWVGAVLLEAMFQETSIGSSEFMTLWQDQLPENWRAQASLNLLAGTYTDLGDGQIQFRAEKPPPNQQAAPPAPITNAKGASKWHARLKSNR